MIDIKPEVAETLSDIAEVALAFPETHKRLPLIVMSENENTARVTLGGRERYSTAALQLDVYADNEDDAESIAAEVSAAMTAIGFTRTFGALMTDERVPRKCMRFRAVIDNCNGRVYKA